MNKVDISYRDLLFEIHHYFKIPYIVSPRWKSDTDIGLAREDGMITIDFAFNEVMDNRELKLTPKGRQLVEDIKFIESL